MSVNAISNYKIDNRKGFAEFKTVNNRITSFEHSQNKKDEQQERHLSTKGIFLTTFLGVATALAIISKRQGFSLNPKDIANSKVKDWAIFRIYNKKHPEQKVLEFEEPEILTMAAGSAAGGLVGGALFDDKKHFKSKLRESVNQMLGNVIVPVACVGGASRIYDKYRDKILNIVPQIKYSTNNRFVNKLTTKLSPEKLNVVNNILAGTVKYTNKFLKVIPPSGITIAALTTGILAGNRVSNFINEKVFHKKVERKIHSTDFAPHVDDLSMAISLMADKSALSSVISRTIPAFLCVPGIEVGTHR